MLLVQMEKLLKDLLMQLKEEEITIASGFMDAVLIPVGEMVVNLQEMVVPVVVCINIITYLFNNSTLIGFLTTYSVGEKEEAENEVGEQPRRYQRQPRQQNWYNSYRGNRRGPPPNRGEGGDYNVSIVKIIIIIN